MHGSFDVKAVQKFYSFYDADLKEDFSESNLYDFSSTGSRGRSSCSNFSDKSKRKSIKEMHMKAKGALDAANAKVLEEYSEENLNRLALAKQLYDLTSQRYAKEQEDNKAALQYAEYYDERELANL